MIPMLISILIYIRVSESSILRMRFDISKKSEDGAGENINQISYFEIIKVKKTTESSSK